MNLNPGTYKDTEGTGSCKACPFSAGTAGALGANKYMEKERRSVAKQF